MTEEEREQKKLQRKPDWLKTRLPGGKTYSGIRGIVDNNKLHTICKSGHCPNIGECWGAGTATFMILGDICTRSCRFCNVKTGRPLPPDPDEPEKIALSVQLMKLKHAVITSVDRDDLPDGGAAFWAKTIIAIRNLNPGTSLETLIPDFKGDKASLDIIIEAHPEVVSHNLETVRRMTKEVRNLAIYDRSLGVLKYLKEKGMVTKSGIMVGVGETDDEVLSTMDDLLETGCDIMTIGQYLQPGKQHLEVARFVAPDLFDYYKNEGLKKGFMVVESGPLVRSSYHAEKHLYFK